MSAYTGRPGGGAWDSSDEQPRMTAPTTPAPDVAEIVRRLRHMSKLLGVGYFDIPSLLNEAADALQRTSAVNAVPAGSFTQEQYHQMRSCMAGERDRAEDRAIAAEARLAEAVEVLEQIAGRRAFTEYVTSEALAESFLGRVGRTLTP